MEFDSLNYPPAGFSVGKYIFNKSKLFTYKWVLTSEYFMSFMYIDPPDCCLDLISN